MEEITIIITKKVPYNGSADSPPTGDLYEGNLKYTCWKSEDFNKYNVGDTVVLHYTSKDNTYEGRTFTNRNISRMEDLKSSENTETIETTTKTYENENNSPKSVSTVVKMGDIEYELTLRLIT